MNKTVVVVFRLALEQFDNLTLAALNNAVQGFGQVAEGNMAYQPALEAGLIEKDGQSVDLESLKDACATEVNHRVDAGTFV